jgi:hypothetical protein
VQVALLGSAAAGGCQEASQAGAEAQQVRLANGLSAQVDVQIPCVV